MWNNQYQTLANWAGNKKQETNLYVSTLTVDTINAKVGNITGISSSVIATGYLVLNNAVMTTIDNILYVNGQAVTTPSTLSTIAEWSYFPALTNVNLNGSTIKNALGISTTYLTANIISNTTLNNATIFNTTFNGRNVNCSTLRANVANISLTNTSSLIASNAIIPKLNAYSILTNTISSQSIYNNSLSTTFLTANTINNVVLSSIYISANTAYISQAEIPDIRGSSIEFTTALGKDLFVSSMLLNRSIYTPDAEDNDGAIAFASSDLNNFYGIITTSENRSSFSVGAANNLTLVGASSIQMLGFDGIDMRTNPERYIRMATTALSVDASGVVINAEQFNTNALMSTNAITADIIGVNNISANTITTNTINANTYLNFPSTFSTEWSLYKAISTVTAELNIFNEPQYDIKDFLNIEGAVIHAKPYFNPLFPAIPVGGTINADISVNAPTGNFDALVADNGFIGTVEADHIDVGNTITNDGDMNIYGSLLPPGDNALYVEGGTTLSGAGLIHGVSIGAQTVGGINLQRIDVLPTNIDIISDTFITIDALAFANVGAGGAVSIAAGGATSVAAGGALSLAGGSYIEYDTDQNYFINTSAGNDYTDIYVGNIHGADGGTDQLRINDNRGVKLDNVTEINLKGNVYNAYDSNVLYNQNDIIEYEENKYVAVLSNRYINPTSTIAYFNSTIGYDIGNYVLSTNTFSWNCISTINIPYTTSTPSIELSTVWTPFDGISTVNQIWGSYISPGVSKIIGDNDSYLNIGKISTSHISTNDINAKIMKSEIVYTDTIGNPNPIVPTNIFFNNGINLAGNDIVNGNIANFETLNMSTINGNQVVLITNDFLPASVLLYNIDSALTGAIGVFDSNTVGLVGFDKTKITSANGTLIESYSNIDISSNTLTQFTGNVLMSSLSLTSIYGFNLSQSNQVQHWNGTSYDYFIPQLSYTDLSNNTTAAVASDWAYYSAKNNLNMNGYNISNVGTINYTNLIADNIYAENGYFSNITLSNYLTFISPTTSATAALTFDIFTYSNGNSNDSLYFRNHPFLANDGYSSSKNNLLQIQATQYIDNSNFFCYLQFVDNEANVVIANQSNILQSQYFVAAHWSKYDAIQTVNIASNNISNANTLGLVSPYGFNLSQSNQVQHWNAGGGYYDYYIAQLSYTDISNNRTRAVASDWSYYPCENLLLDMSGGFITNVGGLSINTLGIKQATSGYTNAGIVYEQLPGDEMFFQLSKPSLDGTSPQGSEGIFIVERSTADGSELAHGRIFDDGIYKPEIGSDLSNNVFVVGTLDMASNVISNVNKMYYGATRQPFIQYGDVSFAGGGTQTVTLPVNYVNSNYVVQATYSVDPGSSAKPIHIDSRTTSNFTISAQSGHAAYWTTFGNNN